MDDRANRRKYGKTEKKNVYRLQKFPKEQVYEGEAETDRQIARENITINTAKYKHSMK